MKKILITGANSYIGTSFEKYLQQWPDEYLVDTIDMLDENWRNADFSGYDVVFHVAGIAHSDSGKITDEQKDKYYKVNTQLTIETANKAKSDGVGQFVFMSSAIVYGNSAPIGLSNVITKDTKPDPNNCYSESKLLAEQGLQKLDCEQFKVVVLRPPMIYGEGCKGNYRILSKIAKKSPIFPYVDNQRSMLYIEHLAEFVRLMVDNNERGVFCPQNNKYTNTSEMVATIAEVNGKKVRLVKGFSWVLKILSHFTGLVNKAFGSLCYDKELSAYKVDYCKNDFKTSIAKTEVLQ